MLTPVTAVLAVLLAGEPLHAQQQTVGNNPQLADMFDALDRARIALYMVHQETARYDTSILRPLKFESGVSLEVVAAAETGVMLLAIHPRTDTACTGTIGHVEVVEASYPFAMPVCGVYVPPSLDAAVDALAGRMTAEERQSLAAMNRAELVKSDLRWALRERVNDDWGLYHESRLENLLMGAGVTIEEDRSGVLIEALRRKLRGEAVGWQSLLAEHRSEVP